MWDEGGWGSVCRDVTSGSSADGSLWREALATGELVNCKRPELISIWRRTDIRKLTSMLSVGVEAGGGCTFCVGYKKCTLFAILNVTIFSRVVNIAWLLSCSNVELLHNCPYWTHISISFVVTILVVGLKLDTPMDKVWFAVRYFKYLISFDFWVTHSDIHMNGYILCCHHHQLSCCYHLSHLYWHPKWEVFQCPLCQQRSWWRKYCSVKSSSPSLCSQLYYQHPWYHFHTS